MISGGGTGGHVFPAIAIANAIRKINHQAEILFVGSLGKMEMEKVPAAGYSIEGLWISGLQRRLSFQNLLFPIKLISSLLKSMALIRKFKPQVVVGVGGYASGPLLYAATAKKIPALIQEQNSFPGITNKLLAKRVNKICVAYDDMERFFPKDKILLTGNPVRQDMNDLESKKVEAKKYFNIPDGASVLLIIGGSLGARTINLSVANHLESYVKSGLHVIWQTGKSFKVEAANISSQYSDKVWVSDFITRMDLAYSIADVVVSRAGAISISELAVVSKPVVLVPSPNVAEDHQTKNAMNMVKSEAAILVKDSESIEKLGKTVLDLFGNEEKRIHLKKNISALAKLNAADAIAQEVVKLAQRSAQ